MLRKLSLVLVTVCSVGLAACGSARVIQRTQNGGVLELQGDRSKAEEDAGKQMAAQCGPGNYHVTLEGEEAIGTDTVDQSNTDYGEHTSRNGRNTQGGSSTQAQSSTRTATAWRVHFECGSGGAPAPAPMGPPQDGGPSGPPPPQPGY